MLRLLTPTRCCLIIIALSSLLLLAHFPGAQSALINQSPPLYVRQILPPFGGGGNGGGGGNTNTGTQTSGSSTSNSGTSTSATTSPSTTPSTPTSSDPTTSNTGSTTTTSTSSTVTSTSATSTSSAATDPQNTTANASPSPSPSVVVTTNSQGQTITNIVTQTLAQSGTSTSAGANSTDSSDSVDGGNSPSGRSELSTIIGVSVAGGVAAIGLISFFIWKFTRKRFADFDDNEAIKWPELNTHGGESIAPLPTKATGRAGVDMSTEDELSRSGSRTGDYASTIGAQSTTDLYTNQDPYAVPALPHLNPNLPGQPYRDDPSAYGASAYYDPYRGPVPPTFYEPQTATEAIPMTQMASRTRSPGPQVLYGDDMTGRGSPAPMAGRRSPGPQAVYGGYGDGRRSPAPSVGLGGSPVAGRRSPGPQIAYDPTR